MFTKEEASAIRQKFWTTLGKYMQPIPSASAEKVNWINYRTGIKHIQLKLVTEAKYCLVSVLIKGDEETRSQDFKRFSQMGFMLEPEPEWLENSFDENGAEVARITSELESKSIFRESDWPDIISFFKENLILFDAFWSENKFVFEMA